MNVRGSRGRRFKVSAAASVGASVLRTEVSTGHPHPVTRTRKSTSKEVLFSFIRFAASYIASQFYCASHSVIRFASLLRIK